MFGFDHEIWKKLSAVFTSKFDLDTWGYFLYDHIDDDNWKKCINHFTFSQYGQ